MHLIIVNKKVNVHVAFGHHLVCGKNGFILVGIIKDIRKWLNVPNITVAQMWDNQSEAYDPH